MVIELQRNSSIILAIIIPIIILILSLISIKLSKREDNSWIKRVARFLREPFQFKQLRNNPELSQLPETETRKIIRKELLLRLNLVYIIIIFFLFCSFLGELYQVLADRTIFIIVANAETGTFPPDSVWTSIVFESPFSAGFTGFQLWYGNYPNPIIEIPYYHQGWGWIFYTSGLYTNLFPNMQYLFFGAKFNSIAIPYSIIIIVFILVIGGIFLLPLLLKGIRKSFLASLFFFEAGMIIGTKGIFSCFAQAWKIEVNGQLLQYGAYIVSRTSVAAEWVILGLIPVIIGFYFFFLWIGKKIWNYHYSQTKSISKKTFVITFSVNYIVALLVLLF